MVFRWWADSWQLSNIYLVLLSSLSFQDLVSKMLVKDPLDRLSAAEVQEHVWIAVSMFGKEEHSQNATLVTHIKGGLLKIIVFRIDCILSKKETSLKTKEFAPCGAHSFLVEQFPMVWNNIG